MLRQIFFFQAEDGIRDVAVTGVQTCALPICIRSTARMSTRFVSIRRKRSRAWSSRRRDRRPRRRLLYLASREASSLTGSSPETRARDALEALERLGLERGVLRDVVHDHLEGLGATELLRDRKSTRLNSSHGYISYAVFCLKKKNNRYVDQRLPTEHVKSRDHTHGPT